VSGDAARSNMKFVITAVVLAIGTMCVICPGKVSRFHERVADWFFGGRRELRYLRGDYYYGSPTRTRVTGVALLIVGGLGVLALANG